MEERTNLDSGRDVHSQYCDVSPHVIESPLAPTMKHFFPLPFSSAKLCAKVCQSQHFIYIHKREESYERCLSS